MRIAQPKEAQHVLIHEVEPEEAVVVSGAAVESEVEPGRHAPRRQNVPGRGDSQKNQQAAQNMQAPPDMQHKKLLRNSETYQCSADWHYHANQTLQEHANGAADRKQRSPAPGARFFIVRFERALK